MLFLINRLTALLNHWFAPLLVALMTRLGIHVAHPTRPINNTLALELVVMTLLLLYFIAARLSLSVEKPGALQHTAESIHGFVSSQAEQIVGPGSEPYVPYATTIGLFVLTCNCFGLLPGFETPTANPVVPLGIAIPTFLYYNWQGVKAQGAVGYFKHFLGPIWWISWLIFPIEVISHLARMLSLTIRLYANMFASDLLTLAFFSLIPIGIPVIFLGLHLFVSLIQAYVFMLLTLIYLSQATSHDDEAAHA
jgi:F-type H+-transporting ATPase subunit a